MRRNSTTMLVVIACEALRNENRRWLRARLVQMQSEVAGELGKWLRELRAQKHAERDSVTFANVRDCVYCSLRSEFVAISRRSPSANVNGHSRFPRMLYVDYSELTTFGELRILSLPLSMSVCMLHDMPSWRQVYNERTRTG